MEKARGRAAPFFCPGQKKGAPGSTRALKEGDCAGEWNELQPEWEYASSRTSLSYINFLKMSMRTFVERRKIMMRILNGVVHTMAGAGDPHGYVEVENGKIRAVGEMSAWTAAAAGPVYDAGAGTSCPVSSTPTAIWACSAMLWALRPTTATSPPTPVPHSLGPSTPSIPRTAAFARPGGGRHHGAHRAGQRQSHRRAVCRHQDRRTVGGRDGARARQP
jgi:hypothetical protein